MFIIMKKFPNSVPNYAIRTLKFLDEEPKEHELE